MSSEPVIRVRGLTTNLQFLENVIAHPQFRSGECITRFIDDTPELFQFSLRRDRATKILSYLGDVIVKGRTTPVAIYEVRTSAPAPAAETV